MPFETSTLNGEHEVGFGSLSVENLFKSYMDLMYEVSTKSLHGNAFRARIKMSQKEVQDKESRWSNTER